MPTQQVCSTKVGVFQTRAAADKAVADLKAAGYRDDQIGLVAKNAGYRAGVLPIRRHVHPRRAAVGPSVDRGATTVEAVRHTRAKEEVSAALRGWRASRPASAAWIPATRPWSCIRRSLQASVIACSGSSMNATTGMVLVAASNAVTTGLVPVTITSGLRATISRAKSA